MAERGWHAFRGFDAETIRRAREFYLQYFGPGGRLLDAGCGRGEFLDAAAAAGFAAKGIDADPGAVAHCRARGLDVEQQDALEYLRAHPVEFDGIFCSHLIEHLAPGSARELIAACAGVQKAGGVLCLVTPNPGSLPTVTHEFWRDPTHIRPYDLEALEYLCVENGLEIVHRGVNPQSQRGLPIDPSDLIIGSGGLPPPPPAGQSRLAGIVAAIFQKSRLSRELQAVIHGQRLRIERLEAQQRLLAGALRRLLDVLYEPSEIFVVARKPG